MKLINEKPDLVSEILTSFMDAPDIDKHADDFLNNAVNTAMKVMNYEEVAQTVQENTAYEEYNHDKYNTALVFCLRIDFSHSLQHPKTLVPNDGVYAI